MASSFLPDPLQMWRDALNRLETDVNSLAAGGMQSQEVLRALHQFSNISMGIEKLFEKVVAGYLRKANLPSRKEIAELALALQRIEDKVDRLLPAAPRPRPARTRRPPAPAAKPVPAPAPPAPAAKSGRAPPRGASRAPAKKGLKA